MSRQSHVLTLASLFLAASIVPALAQTTEDLARQVSDLAVQYDQSTDATQRADLLKQLQSASVALTQAAMPLDRNGNVVDNPGTRENAARFTLMTIGKSLDPCDYTTVSQDLVGSNADWYGLSLPPSFNLGYDLSLQTSCDLPARLAEYGYPVTARNMQQVRQNSYQPYICTRNCTRNLWEFSYRKPEPPAPTPVPAPIQVEPAPVRGLW
jgi:hypothetical protein